MPGALDYFDLVAAQRLLYSMPKRSIEVGKYLLLRGHITDLQELDDHVHFRATVHTGNQAVAAELLYQVAHWVGFCQEHGEGARCEHVCGLVQMLIAEFNGRQVQKLSSMDGGQKAVAMQRALANQEVSSDLAPKLAAALGRPLKAVESNYLRLIHRIYLRVSKHRVFNSWDFEELGFQAPYGQMKIWEAPPQSEHEFWLYVAQAALMGKFTIPEYMVPITDLEAIERRIAVRRRKQEVDHWINLLAGQYHENPSGSRAEVREADLRVVIDLDALRLQWKRADEAEYTVLRKALFRDLLYNSRRQIFSPEGELIWSRLAVDMGYDGQVPWKIAESGTLLALGRLVRLPYLRDHIVNAVGRPIEHSTEPLRWEMTPAQTENEDYQFRLVSADGSAPPMILAALPVHPALYLTPDAVFPGPPKALFPVRAGEPIRIPAPALERNHGVALLQHLAVELPERISRKVRKIPLKVLIECHLEPIYLGSKTENCAFEVSAVADDGLELQWLGTDWHPISGSKNKASEEIILHDNSSLALVPPLLAALDLKNTVGGLVLRVNKAFPEKFAQWLRGVPSAIEVRLAGDLASFAAKNVAGRVKLEIQETVIDWFDLSVLVDVNDATLTPEEIKVLLNARGGYVRLAGKGWKRLQFDLTEEEDQRLARLGLNPRELSAEPQRLHTLQLANKAAEQFLPAEQVERVQRRAKEIKARVAPQVPQGMTAELRQYQCEGYHFLAYLTANHFGGILADDMGLGKTVQTLSWLLYLREKGKSAGGDGPAPTLVVCPKSVMDNWQAEAQRFAPELRVRIWLASDLRLLRSQLGSADLHVLNYSQLRNLGESLTPVIWLAVILDEGQYIKNPSSQTAQVARSLNAENRLILTGTPIENRLMDLWSLMSFAMPGVLGSRAQFTRLYDAKDDPLARQRLSARVRPFLLRRTKSQVAKDLPDRIEEDLFCEIEGEQLTLYRAELKNAQQRLLRITTQKELAEQQFHFLTSLLRLRQICCHPKLIKPDSKAASAKLEALLEQLESLMEEGQKVLVFSQFVELLNLVRPALEQREWKTFYLAGHTENRGALVREFQKTKGPAVFLISLKAGGFGLNLTAASYVVLFDPWWNPAVENQAIDRTHRIGQNNKVIAYRLLIKNSIEEKIRALQRTKKALSEEVLGEEKFSQSLTLDDLRFLLTD